MRALGALGVAAALVVVLGPRAARVAVEAGLSRALDARVTVERLEVAPWPAPSVVVLEGVRASRDDGEVLTVSRVEAHLPGGRIGAAWDALRGAPPVDRLEMQGARVFAARLAAARKDRAGGPAAERGAALRLDVRLRRSEVVLDGARGSLVIPLSGSAGIDAPLGATLVASASLRLGDDESACPGPAPEIPGPLARARGALAVTLTADLARGSGSCDATAAGVSLSAGGVDLLSLERGDVRARWTASSLEVERADLARPLLRVERLGDGRVALAGVVLEGGPRGDGRGSLSEVLVRRARVRDGALLLRDATPSPAAPFEARLEAIAGTAVNLPLGAAAPAPAAPTASARAPRASPPGSFELSATAPGLLRQLRAQGLLRRPAGAGAPVEGQVLAQVADVDLERASRALVRAARIGFASGRASLDARLDLLAGRFEGFARITSGGLALGGPGHVSRTVPGAVPVSVERALELLRDDEGRIELLVPLAGDRDTGRLDLGEMAGAAVSEALSKALARTLGGGGARPR